MGRALNIFEVSCTHSFQRWRMAAKSLIFALLVSVHACALFVLDAQIRPNLLQPSIPELMTTWIIQPRIVPAGTPDARKDAERLTLKIPNSIKRLDIAVPDINFAIERNDVAQVAAPIPAGLVGTDSRRFAQLAGLLPGEGATVVLRVEVLTSGVPGRIEVAFSSGAPSVDRAAIAYARTQRWSPGLVDGREQPVWVQYGVHLRA